MSTILIATDFSSASRNASLYGTELARLLKAKIILFSAYQVPHAIPGLSLSTSEYGVMKETEQKLNNEAAILDPSNSLSLQTIGDNGVSETAIINIAKEKKADFIVIGMKGSGKNYKKVFGNTATSLSGNINVPVIIVPEEAKFKQPQTIVFASDINLETDTHALDQLTEITQLFNSKVYVVKVVKTENEECLEVLTTPRKLSKAFIALDASFEYPVDADISHALNLFIEKHNVDLLVMMPHKHEWVERLFRKSETKNMMFHTHVPLLILPENY